MSITENDINAYLATPQSFSFELEILSRIKSEGLTCNHTGAYQDSEQKKIREFDIRSELVLNDRIVTFAIECKNFDLASPILTYCVPRLEEEAEHDLLINAANTNIQMSESHWISLPARSFSVTEKNKTLYQVGQPVAKSITRLSGQAPQIKASDSEIYDRYSQALQSAHDVIWDVYSWGKQATKPRAASILPVLVVPDGCLHSVLYREDGKLQGACTPVSRVSYKVNRRYEIGHYDPKNSAFNDRIIHVISHLEIVTSTGLTELINFLKNQASLNDGGIFGGLPSNDVLRKSLQHTRL